MNKKIKSILLCSCMVISLLSSTICVSAKDMSVDNPEVEKVLSVADGITVPNSTFSFTVQKNTTDGPDIHVANITIAEGTENDTSDKIYAYGSILNSDDEVLSATDFPHAGVYEYVISEVNGGDYTPDISNDAITYDTKSYKFSVNVINSGASDLEIASMVIKDMSAQGDDKATSITFNNKYEKTSSLSVSKNVIGNYADRTKDFDFQITITSPSTSSISEFTGKIGDEDVVLTSGVQGTFRLHHGESLVFDSLPTGSTFVVSEVGATDGYMAKATVVENGASPVVISADADSDGVSSASSGDTNLVGENTNSVLFENTLEDNPATGIVMNNLPYILIVAVIGAGLIVYLVARRKIVK